MEDRESRRSSKASIMNIQMDNHLVIGESKSNCSSPTLIDPIYAEKVDFVSNTPIVRYFRSAGKLNHHHYATSPLAAVENLELSPGIGRSNSKQIYGTPVKVDEEVIVMDGILLTRVSGGGSNSKIRSSAFDSSSSSSSGKCLYKTDICRSWEDSGSCRYSNKCQFAHGKEEIRSARLAVKNKPKFRNSHHQLMGVTVTSSEAINRKEAQMALSTMQTSSIHKYMNNKPKPIPTISIQEWSPEDDAIKIILPNSFNGETSKREDVNRHIHDLLYGSTEMTNKRKRLPVFTRLFPEI